MPLLSDLWFRFMIPLCRESSSCLPSNSYLLVVVVLRQFPSIASRLLVCVASASSFYWSRSKFTRAFYKYLAVPDLSFRRHISRCYCLIHSHSTFSPYITFFLMNAFIDCWFTAHVTPALVLSSIQSTFSFRWEDKGNIDHRFSYVASRIRLIRLLPLINHHCLDPSEVECTDICRRVTEL